MAYLGPNTKPKLFITEEAGIFLSRINSVSLSQRSQSWQRTCHELSRPHNQALNVKSDLGGFFPFLGLQLCERSFGRCGEQQQLCSPAQELEPGAEGTDASPLPATPFGCSLGTAAR